MKNILLADDEKSSLTTLADGLRAYCEDWNILTAENGKQAIEIVEGHPVDLVVTDLKMPVMNGYELLVYLMEKKAGMPVVVMTAEDSSEVEKNLLSFGITQHLIKPFDFSDMTRAIESQLSRK